MGCCMVCTHLHSMTLLCKVGKPETQGKEQNDTLSSVRCAQLPAMKDVTCQPMSTPGMKAAQTDFECTEACRAESFAMACGFL